MIAIRGRGTNGVVLAGLLSYLAPAHGAGHPWLLAANLEMFGADQPGLRGAAGLISRVLPTVCVLALLGAVLASRRDGQSQTAQDVRATSRV